MRNYYALFVVFLFSFLAACGGGSNTSSEADNASSGEVTPSAMAERVITERVSEQEYISLTEEEKYAIANKAMCTLFKGVSPEEFFDVTNGFEPLSLAYNENMLSQIEADLLVGINETAYRNQVNRKYYFDEKQKPIQYQLALLHELPISRNFFEVWMAYHLCNSILFSPAVELDSVSYDDAQIIFERLVTMLRQRSSIREIVYAHMISQENWRRFRSPEDNTREMMEIFLGRFIDAEVPLAAQSCRNWSLSDRNDGYVLLVGDDQNADTVEILDTHVRDCLDFYEAVSNHKDLIPTIVSAIVDIFLAGYSTGDKDKLIAEIVSGSPETFGSIFTNIIFSKTYLFSVERPKHFEELFFALSDKMDWYASRKFFHYLNRKTSCYGYPCLNNIKQSAMTYKLGRQVDIPVDTLSFANYHKMIREKLMLDLKYKPDNADDGGWQQSFIAVDLTGNDFIDYLFLTALSRRATDQELDTLNGIFSKRGYQRDDRKKQQAMIVLDYLSRLSELYYTQPFE